MDKETFFKQFPRTEKKCIANHTNSDCVLDCEYAKEDCEFYCDVLCWYSSHIIWNWIEKQG